MLIMELFIGDETKIETKPESHSIADVTVPRVHLNI